TDTPSPGARLLVRVPYFSEERQPSVGTISIPRIDSGASTVDPTLSSLLPSAQTADFEAADSIPVSRQTSSRVVDLRAAKLAALLAQELTSGSYPAAL